MNPRTSLAPPVPELPVIDVERAQQHYRNVLGFEVNWLYPDKSIGTVSRGGSQSFFVNDRHHSSRLCIGYSRRISKPRTTS
jgi:hypothetical protein